jgi:hypothetical protein
VRDSTSLSLTHSYFTLTHLLTHITLSHILSQTPSDVLSYLILEIDTGAWLYAIRRLPANVTVTYVFLFLTQVPPIFLHPGLNNKKIVTSGRRRLIFALAPGKDLVLIREDESDVLDFLSCLCLHAVEAEKLRRRLASAGPWTARLLQGRKRHTSQSHTPTLPPLPFF